MRARLGTGRLGLGGSTTRGEDLDRRCKLGLGGVTVRGNEGPHWRVGIKKK
jgi:hypothetical protein